MTDLNEHLSPPRSAKCRAPRRHRGVASAEAVVAFPFFVLIIIGLYYLRGAVAKKHELSMTARTCAWLYSANSCQSIPAGCQNVLGSPGTSPTSASDDLHGKVNEKKQTLAKFVQDIVDEVLSPVLDAAFGESFNATSHGSVTHPKIFGAGTLKMSGQYHLACNLVEQEPLDVVTNAWKKFKQYW